MKQLKPLINYKKLDKIFRTDGLPDWWTQLEKDAETCPTSSRCRGHSHGIKLKNYDGKKVKRSRPLKKEKTWHTNRLYW